MGACFELDRKMGCGFLDATGYRLGLLVKFEPYRKVESHRIIV
jgi:hypothetical protein